MGAATLEIRNSKKPLAPSLQVTRTEQKGDKRREKKKPVRRGGNHGGLGDAGVGWWE